MVECVIVGSRPNLTDPIVTCYSIKAGMEICRVCSCWREEVVGMMDLRDRNQYDAHSKLCVPCQFANLQYKGRPLDGCCTFRNFGCCRFVVREFT